MLTGDAEIYLYDAPPLASLAALASLFGSHRGLVARYDAIAESDSELAAGYKQ